MLERLDDGARKVMSLSAEEARTFNHVHIGTEHLLLGLLLEEEGVAAEALDHLGITPDLVRERVESIVGSEERRSESRTPLSHQSQRVVEKALGETLQLGRNYIGTEHILLALLKESEGVAATILSDLGCDPEKIRKETLRRIRGPKQPTTQPQPPGEVVRPSASWPRARSSSVENPLSRSLRIRRAHLSIESTGENRRADLDEAVNALQSPPLIWLMNISKTYRRGEAGDDSESLYKVVAVEGRMSAIEILRYIQGIESTLRSIDGERKRKLKSTRIRLLLYEQGLTDQQDLTVPHPSVLLPHNLKGLAEIDPGLKVPEVSIEALMGAVDVSDVSEAEGEE